MRRAPEPTGLSLRDHERADLCGRANVRAAAQLARVVVDLDDAHLVAVLLAEEHHRAELARLVDRRHERAHGDRLEDLLVDDPLDALLLLRRERLVVREVEAQLVRAHGRAGLLDVVAEHVAQRLRAAGASPCGSPASGSGRVQLTAASTRVPAASGAWPPSSTTSTWSSPNLSTSATSSARSLAVDGDRRRWSLTWPPLAA